MDIVRQARVVQHAQRRAQDLRAVFLDQVFKGLFRHYRYCLFEKLLRAKALLHAA
jgi:hypothetical protein